MDYKPTQGDFIVAYAIQNNLTPQEALAMALEDKGKEA